MTEGKTDAQLLKLAIKKLNLKEFSDWEIKPVISGKTNNNEALARFLQDMSDNMSAIKPVIGMFDRDTEIRMKCKNGEIKDIRTCDFLDLDNNVYAFAIPVPHNRAEENQISIEHYFTDQEIKTEIDGKRLFMGNEFYETGVCKENKQLFFSAARNVSETIKIIEHESKKYVKEIDGTGDYSISKERFVEAIESECDGFKDISFEEFYKIFNILKEIFQIAK